MWKDIFKPKKNKKKLASAGMKLSKNGLNELIKHEGFRFKMYKDVAGYHTIGVGHLLTKVERLTGKMKISNIKVNWKKGLTKKQVKQLLRQDIAKFEKAINKKVKVSINQHQFDALVSFSFNVGIIAFTFSTLLRRLNKRLYNEVPTQLKRWNKAGGRVVKGLVNRRIAEAKLFKRTV